MKVSLYVNNLITYSDFFFFSSLCKHYNDFSFLFCSNLWVESVDDSSEVEGIDLGTFGQFVGPPSGFLGNDDEHDNYHDISDL